jgi:hypothetical protein
VLARAYVNGRSMAARNVLAALALVFFAAAMARGRGAAHAQTRTWLLIAAIFAVVSGWLFVRG